MIITTVFNKNYMTFEYCTKQPTQMFELNLNMLIYEKPRLKNSMDRNLNHP